MVHEIYFTPKAEENYDKLDPQLREKFRKHLDKISLNFVPGKHLKHGLPYFVEKVTESTRFSFTVSENIITIIRCFKNHKEYEEWYKNL